MKPEYDPQEEQIVKLLDLRIIPILVVAFFINLVNRSNLDYARTNMQADLKMGDWAFVLCLAGIFLGSLPFVLPSTMVLRILHPSRWFAIIMASTGILICCMATAANWEGVFAVRVLLGATQAGFVPCVLLYLALFYTRDERTVRLSLVVGVATCASAFSAVLSKSIESLDGAWGMAGWRWLFLIEGLVGTACGFFIWSFLPDFPETATFLSPADRFVAASRVRDEDDPDPVTPSTSISRRGSRAIPAHLSHPKAPPHKFHVFQLREVFQDPQFYIFAFIYFCLIVSLDACTQLATDIAAGTFTNGSGVTPFSLDAALVSIVPYCIAAFCSVMWAYRSDMTGDRGLHIALALLLAGVGFAVVAIIPETKWELEVVITNKSTATTMLSTTHLSLINHSTLPQTMPFSSFGNMIPAPTPSSTAPSNHHQPPPTSALALTPSEHRHDASAITVTLAQSAATPDQLATLENDAAEEADTERGFGDGGVLIGALRYFLGLFPASIGLLCALPCLLAFAMDRAHGSTAREAAAALVTAMGTVGGGVAVPFLFPLREAPAEEAEGIATWGRGYAAGCGACAIACAVGAGAALVVRYMKRQEDEGMWGGRGRGLRRLLNDAEEKGAWDEEGGDSTGDVVELGPGPAIAQSCDSVAMDSDWDLRAPLSKKYNAISMF
ncbi:hypothetical protein HK101_005338 [Irineochytrium annulatum]|nr:hypothetical protein HK101_005338 [Irineochytrium annulatum]